MNVMMAERKGPLKLRSLSKLLFAPHSDHSHDLPFGSALRESRLPTASLEVSGEALTIPCEQLEGYDALQ